MQAPRLVVNSEEEINEEKQETSDKDLFGPVPNAPDWMGFEAKMEWIRSAKELHEKGKLKGGVIGLLENWCIAIGYVRELEKMLQEDGKIIGGKAHPGYKMLLDTMNNARALANEIGFTKKINILTTIDKEEDEVWGDKSLLA